MRSIAKLGILALAVISMAVAVNVFSSNYGWDPTATASVQANGTGPGGTGSTGSTGPTGGTGPTTEDPDDGTTAGGGGVVSPGGDPARILCSWQLPDMQSDSPGIQFQSSPGMHDHDDDVNVRPNRDGDASSGEQPPCQGPESGQYPDQPDGVRHMVHVLPNAEDEPESARVQLWAAVDHPSGLGAIDDAYWKVYHPDGSFKTQVHAAEDDGGGVVRGSVGNCEDWGSPSTDDTMYHAAVHSGQLSVPAANDINNGLISLCQQRVVALYYSEFQISKHQPCGEYKIELHTVSDGSESILTSYIDVICFFDLSIDFDQVNWGSIQPGVEKTVPGDLDPDTSGRPTVKNRGNHGMFVGVQFSEMVQQGVDGGKVIDLFDAGFGKSPSHLLHLDAVPASKTAWFDDDPGTNEGFALSGPDQVLCSNDFGKLDLSIKPTGTLPVGEYVGSLQVLVKPAHGYCPTDQESHDQ